MENEKLLAKKIDFQNVYVILHYIVIVIIRYSIASNKNLNLSPKQTSCLIYNAIRAYSRKARHA